jgi:hypothetical protein
MIDRDESPHASRARALKAGRVADMLDRMYGPQEAQMQASQAGEDEWARWAAMAEVRPLSARTRALVRSSLLRRANPPADPFAGL